MVRGGLGTKLGLAFAALIALPVAARAQAPAASATPDAPAPLAAPSALAPPSAEDSAPPAQAKPSDPRNQLWLDLGMGYTRRELDYDTRPNFSQAPPNVTSGGVSLRFDGEIYPFALNDPHSPLRNLGVALAYDKTVGSSLQRMFDGQTGGVDQSAINVGVRYRFPLDADSMIAVGLDYVNRGYSVDTSNVFGRPTIGAVAGPFDVPDTNYSAIAPTLEVRASIASGTTLYVAANGWLAFDAGDITSAMRYGQAAVYGFTTVGGAQFELTKRINLNVLFEYTRVELEFDGNPGSLANDRDNNNGTQDVNSATDDSIGVVATLGLTY